jgi:hypothetical protein
LTEVVVGELIGDVVIFAATLWLVWSRVRVRFNNVDQAVDYVLRELAKGTPTGELSKVAVWEAHPLTDHMIKELARSKGFQYREEGPMAGGYRGLRFARRQQKRKSLSIDV